MRSPMSTICGLDFEAYVRLASRVSGLPIAAVRHGAREVAGGLANAVDAATPARPAGATANWREQRGCGGAVWVRRGEVFAVLASGNAPGVHAEWPQALALGYRVAIRPSRREPFTGHRLVHALRQSGFRDDDAVFLPTDYAGADELVGSGRPVDGLRRAGRRRPVRRRPGGARQRAGSDQDPRHRRPGLARLPRRDRRFDRSSGWHGVRQHDGRALRERRALRWRTRSPRGCHRLRRCRSPTNGPFCPSGRWPRRKRWPTTSRSRPRRRYPCSVPTRSSPTSATGTPRYALRCIWSPDRTASRSTSSCRFRASGCRRGHAPQESGRCAARWSSTPSPATRQLIDDLVSEPTIANVYSGRYPTYYTDAAIPHDGFLADFLMRCKGFARD